MLPYQQELDQALEAFIAAFTVIEEQLTIDKSILDTDFINNLQAGNEAFNEVLSQLGLNEANMVGEIIG